MKRLPKSKKGIGYPVPFKIDLKMRLAILCFLLPFLGMQAKPSFAQKTISLNVKEASVFSLLGEIESHTDYHFVYKVDDVDLTRSLNLKVEEERIPEVLNKIFYETDVEYRVIDNYIFLNKRKSFSFKAAPVLFKKEEKQQMEITGTVTDEDGVPLPGVNITVKGSPTGTSTDFDGNYSIQASQGQSLVFSFVGFKEYIEVIGTSSTINVQMEESSSALDEVVVIGYGTQRKRDLTGSVTSVDVNDLESSRTVSVDGLLKGTSGVNVVQNNGAPGASFSINVRGASSVSAGNEPLYVIDGFPVDNAPALLGGSEPGFSENRSPTNPLSSINPSDIESIEILKDASATAIYGARGANGVIMITTKQGKEGRVKINFQTSIGFQTPLNRFDLLSAEDYKRVLNDIIDAGGESEDQKVGDISNDGRGVDWQRAITHNSSLMQNYQLNFSGGTEKTKYYLSFNHVNQDGIVKTTGYKRYGFRFNLNSQVTDRLKIGFNSTASYSTNQIIQNGFATNENAGPLYAAANFDPTVDIKDEEGNFFTSPLLSIDNPLALIEGTTGSSRSHRILANMTAEYKIFEDLAAKLNLGTDFVNEKRKNYIDRLTKNGRNLGGIAGAYQGDKMSYLTELTLNYNKQFDGGHKVNALVGTTFQRFSSSRLNGHANDFPTDATRANNLSLGNQETYVLNNPSSAHRLASFISRINYNLKDKYSATVTLRRDGSSRFGENNHYGTFPSAALAWTISEENFLKNRSAFNFLKLRGSWGLTGNQDIEDFAFQTTYSGSGSAVWDDAFVTSTAPQRLPNPDLKWEQTEQIDVGLEFALWKNRINGEVDFYRKTTKDMLFNLPIPQSTGFSTVLSNIGEIRNSGIDFSLNANIVETNKFQWSMGITLTTLKNKVLNLGDVPEINSGSGFLHVPQVGIIRPGVALNSFYGWEIAGVWQEGDDFSVTQENVAPGDLKYVDQNDDGVIDGNDRVVLGNSFPDLQFSFSSNFKYRKFELSLYFDGVRGSKMLNGNLIESYFPINFRRNKFSEPYLNRWTPDNPTDKYPSFVNPLGQGRNTVNSKTVQSSDFFRLRNVRLSYQFPNSISWFPSGQVFLSVDNLFVISPYGGIDPTINPNNNASLRVDFNSYPTSRTFSVGFQINL